MGLFGSGDEEYASAAGYVVVDVINERTCPCPRAEEARIMGRIVDLFEKNMALSKECDRNSFKCEEVIVCGHALNTLGKQHHWTTRCRRKYDEN